MKFPRFLPCLRHFGGDLRFGPRWLLIDNEAIFLMYLLWRDVGEDYWSIFFSLCIFLHDVMWGGAIGQFFFIMVDKKVIFFKDYLSIFFFFRQTWLRGSHAAPTIESYWLIKKRIASRTCERQHSRHVAVLERGSYFILSHRGLERSRTRYLATRTAVLRGFYRYVQQTKIDRRVHPCSGLFLGRECTRQVLSTTSEDRRDTFL